MPYKLVIFDFDGTLADTFTWFANHIDLASDRYRFRRVDPADIPRLRKQGAREAIQYFGLPFWKIPLVARFLKKLMAQDVKNIRLFDGTAETLRELHGRGVALAVVSSNREENVRAVLGAELASLIRVFACGASLFGKARSFQRVLRKTATAASEAICIGDELRDLHSARAVGIAFGAVSWGYTDPEALAAAGPQAVFEAVEDIIPAVTA